MEILRFIGIALNSFQLVFAVILMLVGVLLLTWIFSLFFKTLFLDKGL